jgi:hypothetical protein
VLSLTRDSGAAARPAAAALWLPLPRTRSRPPAAPGPGAAVAKFKLPVGLRVTGIQSRHAGEAKLGSNHPALTGLSCDDSESRARSRAAGVIMPVI